MIDPKTFLELLQSQGSDFFVGVPDSLLKELCACIDDRLSCDNHIISANEGGAIAIASGRYLATKKIPVVYMQNSGIGNAVNPLLSLSDPQVYSIPSLLLIGWRGEPGIKDEPQHVKQGPITPDLLSVMGIPHVILADNISDVQSQIKEAYEYMESKHAPYALLVKKGTFEAFTSGTDGGENSERTMTREGAITTIIDSLPNDTVYVGTTGKLSRELFELREQRNESHQSDFLTVGSMGHASQIALGITEGIKDRLVVCLDGDGSAQMHLGGLTTIGSRAPENFIHIIINNGVHESVGGQCVTGEKVDYVGVAKAAGYKEAIKVNTADELVSALKDITKRSKPALIDCEVKLGSREDLGRPTTSPQENKECFMKFLHG